MALDSFGVSHATILGMLRLLGPATTPIGTLAALANDGVDLPSKPRMMHVATAGAIKYTANGVTLTETFEVGWHPVRFDRVWAAGLAAVGTVWT